MLDEKISRHLKIPYVELERNGKKYYLCNNGVIFADSEYMDFADLNAEYERRAKEDKLYDYNYAKSTGLLRKKRGYVELQTKQEDNENVEKRVSEIKKVQADSDNKSVSKRNTGDNDTKPVQREIHSAEVVHTESRREGQDISDRRVSGRADKPEAKGKSRSSFLIILILAFASVCSMYESTLHTATYLYDYVDLVSAWLLSTAVTAYNSSAFEVSVMFHTMKRNFMAFIFMLLWAMVTVFSMATTVSVFYDRFNFNETQIAQENKAVDSNKLGLELLRTKEKDLRESIEFKKKDIEYRQERDYATTAVRLELESLQKELQENLTEQQKLLEETPEVMEEKLQKKESLFSFLGRMIGLEGGILEFIMSTLSAIFINLIAPLSLTAVIELNKRKNLD
jgi:hypothetical protein